MQTIIRARVRTGHMMDGATRLVCEESGNHNGCLVVVDDPDECGGFPPGARITQSEAAIMLRMSCFTLGTIIEHHRHGRLLVVPYERKFYRRVNGSRASVIVAQDQQALQGMDGMGNFWLIAPYSTTGSLYVVRRLDVIGVV